MFYVIFTHFRRLLYYRLERRNVQTFALLSHCVGDVLLLTQVMRSYVPLENFWKRYNKVLLDKVAVEKERSIVASQNHQLRSLLKQYLDSMSVSDEVLSKANSLLIVNSRSNVPCVHYYHVSL